METAKLANVAIIHSSELNNNTASRRCARDSPRARGHIRRRRCSPQFDEYTPPRFSFPQPLMRRSTAAQRGKWDWIPDTIPQQP